MRKKDSSHPAKETKADERHEKDERAQAAMEFLLTYGWVIILVLVVIAALVYFGVLHPSKMLPERCNFQIGLQCVDYSASSKSLLLDAQGEPIRLGEEGYIIQPITFNLINKLGKDVYITGLKVIGEGEEYMCSYVDLTCPVETDFLKVLFNENVGGLSFEKRCISLDTFCDKVKEAGKACYPERIFRWEEGSRLKAKIEDIAVMLEGMVISPDYMNFYCLNLPKKGTRLRAQIILTYHFGDPSLTHVAYGELSTTVA